MPNSSAAALAGNKSSGEIKGKSFEAFKNIFKYAAPHKLTFVGVFVCALLGISADLLQPYLVKIIIDDHLAQGKAEFGFIALMAGIYLGITFISFLFTYLQNNLLQFAGQGIVAKIRKDLFHHISKLSMSYFDKVHRGSLVTNVSSDTETISQFFTQVFLSLIRDGMTLVLIIYFMFRLDTTLAWYSLTILPVIGLVAFMFRRYLRQAYQVTRSRLSRLIGFIAENLSGMGLIQAFRQEEEQTRRFNEHNQSYWEGNMREVRANVLFNRTFDILGNLALVLVVWLGGMAVFHHTMEVGVLYAFTSYIRQFFQPINQITMQWNTFQSTTVSMDRIWKILSTEPDVKDPLPDHQTVLKADEAHGKVDFDHISFGYSPANPVIPDLDLHLDAGEMVGIVGTTGAGKSTLISLLNRFYDVNRGSIRIDDIDIRDIPQQQLHRLVGLIQQDPFLFTGSVLDNVRLFQTDISREKVTEACRYVGVHDMIIRMPQGYDSLLSERGSGLSAGERQLISFARIMVFEPRILILDEATAHLDSQTEQLVQNALQTVSKGRTTLIIAHRLSTVMHADRILVMKEGRAVEEGTHDELIAMHGYYEQLYNHARQATEEE
ncbi:ABC transporter ATP-binding protein/permease [Paenibacillus sp. KQZ6P-2]|uniref:ABC transporter ATP-binding protein/permease n=1 Tax=Paenibacillus mangrovi TaxID=2931978 RepID=A0A9X1WTW8_9BACL|nr:ABC transporter ATP-binding protein [Paenibacillus mangrovi]MCJ8013825.1 ABC transporter ATP-binding protein/permease [Paenibacillus mangrovi]